MDTPGTNVILERQQRLTEEFVPRADLVLFVLSADRPFTDSEVRRGDGGGGVLLVLVLLWVVFTGMMEVMDHTHPTHTPHTYHTHTNTPHQHSTPQTKVRFLKYIKQWGKKVVFIVNKCDILEGASEVEEVRAFVADNAARLLGVEQAQVLPVSARMALRAKTYVGVWSGCGCRRGACCVCCVCVCLRGVCVLRVCVSGVVRVVACVVEVCMCGGAHTTYDGQQQLHTQSTTTHTHTPHPFFFRSVDGAASGLFASLSPGNPLAADAGWQSSRFGELERFVYEFLLGGKGTCRCVWVMWVMCVWVVCMGGVGRGGVCIVYGMCTCECFLTASTARELHVPHLCVVCTHVPPAYQHPHRIYTSKYKPFLQNTPPPNTPPPTQVVGRACV